MSKSYPLFVAAEHLRTSYWTVHRLAKDGQLETVQVGRLHHVTESSLASYVASHTEGPDQKPAGDMLPTLLTLPEVARQTGLSLRSLQDGVRTGRITHVHIGKSRLMTPQQVEHLVETHVKTANASDDDGLAPVRARLARRQSRPNAALA